MALTDVQKRMMAKLNELDGAVKYDFNPFANGIEMPTPSLGFILGNTWLIPQGYTVLLAGMPKAGKSIIISAIEGLMHRQDEDAVTVKVNTEMRESVQVTPAQMRLWGIDRDRRIVWEVREPSNIFDRAEQEIPKLCQAGVKVKLFIIDSLQDILGRRQMNADSVDQQQIADKAATIQDGLSRIKGMLRRYGVTTVLTSQVRAEMDQLEIRRGNKIRMATSFAVKHMAEYYLMVENYRNKDGKTDLAGNTFEDNSIQGLDGESDTAAHKLRITCLDNSLDRPGRVAICTLHHDLGFIHQHEEVFLLGVGMQVIGQEKQGYYTYGDRSWHGKGAILEAIQQEPELFAAIVRDCKMKDLIRTRGV